ncbi:MAG: Fibronectin type protein [Candidatus Saccharibacteria bacterium]|nr:Fibronectin type protein [Candidatus Saccharibacteria bacterium]
MKRLVPAPSRLQLWLSLCVLALVLVITPLSSLAATPPVNPGTGSIGLEGKISSDPPKQAASISSPTNGAVFGSVPITVSGLCPKGLLVKIFANNVFVGSAQCETGSYSIQVDLFSNQNEIVARIYDSLDQQGPDSNSVTVTFNDQQFIQFGTHVSLSSIYAKRGADPGQVLTWPIILSGGAGPYAVSIDWGDGSAPDLQSQSFAGSFDIKHSYKSAGVYKIIIKITDANGGTAYLQLVGISNGKVTQSGSGSASPSGGTTPKAKILIWPLFLMLPLIVAAFFIGRRHELYTLRRQLEKSRSKAS